MFINNIWLKSIFIATKLPANACNVPGELILRVSQLNVWQHPAASNKVWKSKTKNPALPCVDNNLQCNYTQAGHWSNFLRRPTKQRTSCWWNWAKTPHGKWIQSVCVCSGNNRRHRWRNCLRLYGKCGKCGIPPPTFISNGTRPSECAAVTCCLAKSSCKQTLQKQEK